MANGKRSRGLRVTRRVPNSPKAKITGMAKASGTHQVSGLGAIQPCH